MAHALAWFDGLQIHTALLVGFRIVVLILCEELRVPYFSMEFCFCCNSLVLRTITVFTGDAIVVEADLAS